MRIREALERGDVAVEQCIKIPIDRASVGDYVHSVEITLMTVRDT